MPALPIPRVLIPPSLTDTPEWTELPGTSTCDLFPWDFATSNGLFRDIKAPPGARPWGINGPGWIHLEFLIIHGSQDSTPSLAGAAPPPAAVLSCMSCVLHEAKPSPRGRESFQELCYPTGGHPADLKPGLGSVSHLFFTF